MKLLVEKSTTPKGLRVDIQLLRAFAVLLVVLFHLWPNVVRSGYIGVDVFFVISGFLITSHLLTEVHASGSVKLSSFWARRARRLLPSAMLVIFASGLLVFTFVPEALWQQFAKQAIASTFYFENWVLAFDAVDYLNSENAPTAVQQYWSLSVEEQFYIVWPILLLLGIWIARNKKQLQRISVLLILLTVSVASFLFSVIQVSNGDLTAYFSTFSRAWEFGVGGLLAFIPARWAKKSWSKLLGLLGLVLLLLSVVTFTTATPFPGIAALLPVLGTALMIFSHFSFDFSNKMLSWPILKIVWIGGISYALYLWHWPLIITAAYVVGHEITLLEKVVLFGLSILLAWLTTKYLEKPVQQISFIKYSNRNTLLVFLLVSVLALVPVLISIASLDSRLEADSKLRAEVVTDSCFGAKTLLLPQNCLERDWPLLTPDPAKASEDIPVEANDCKSDSTKVIICQFGVIGAEQKIALVGDSHAGHWLPAFEQFAITNGFQVDVFFRSSCTYSLVQRRSSFSDCPIWSNKVQEELLSSGPYQWIFITSLAENLFTEIQSQQITEIQASEGFEDAWTPLVDSGSTVIVIRDTPSNELPPSVCLSTHRSKPHDCDQEINSSFTAKDVEYETAQMNSNVSTLDFTDYFCDKTHCFTSIGGAVIYSDSHHITKTFSKSLAPALALEINEKFHTTYK